MSERVAIICNRQAGHGKSGLVNRVAEKLRRGGQHVRMIETEYPGHAVEISNRIAATKEAHVLVAAGGDGTIREVAEGAYGHSTPVGIIPAGSANVLARELGYMKGARVSARHVANALLSKDLVDLYPFEVRRQGRVQLGLCWLGLGLDASILHHVSPLWKERMGRISFVPAVWRALIQDRRLPDIEWQLHKDKGGSCGWGILANTRRYAGPFIVTRKTNMARPGLVCLMSPGHGWRARLVDLLCIGIGCFDRRTNSWELDQATMRVGHVDVPVQIDGDFIGYGEVEVTPKQRALSFRAFVHRK